MSSPLKIGIVAAEASLNLLMESLEASHGESSATQQLLQLISFVPCELSMPGAPAIIMEAQALLIGAQIESEKDGAAVASMLRTLRRFRPDKKALLAVALWGERAENFAEQASHLNVVLPPPERGNLPPGAELRASLLNILRPQLEELLKSSGVAEIPPPHTNVESLIAESAAPEVISATSDVPERQEIIEEILQPAAQSEVPVLEQSTTDHLSAGSVDTPGSISATPAPVSSAQEEILTRGHEALVSAPADNEDLEFLTEDFIFSEDLLTDSPATVQKENLSSAIVATDIPPPPVEAAAQMPTEDSMKVEQTPVISSAPATRLLIMEDLELLDLGIEDKISGEVSAQAAGILQTDSDSRLSSSETLVSQPTQAHSQSVFVAKPESQSAPAATGQDQQRLISELQQILAARETELQELKMELADKTEIHREMLECIHSEHKQELSAHHVTITQLESELAAEMETHATSVEELKHEFENTLKERDAHLHLLEEELKSLHAAAECASAAEQHIQRLEEENSSLKTQLESALLAEKETMQKVSEQFSEQFATQLNEAISAHEAENRKLTVQLAEAVKAEMETCAEVERLHDQVEKLIELMKKTEATLEAEKVSSAAQISQLEVRAAQFEACALELEERSVSLELQNGRFEKELVALTQRAEAAEEQIQTAEERAKFAESKAEDFFQQVVRERKQQKALKAQLQSLEASQQQIIAENSRLAQSLSSLQQAVPGRELTTATSSNSGGQTGFQGFVTDLREGSA
jgi:hypothetical protein